jgi:hypothetical protein
MLIALSPFLGNSTKLDRILPFMVELLDNEVAEVRATSLLGITQIVSQLSGHKSLSLI